ncbi:biotin synthase BioB [Tepidicella baoligensis]|uniref:biotin synthase BioB n=1 Tax=Tepidicella baoligensis TaxID=2707016 RepID=UPI0015DB0CBF|nr:biotin synthase BioB [Tepidicella baoligensis]
MTTVAPISLSSLRRANVGVPETRWSVAAVEALYELPFMDLLFRAQQVHRAHFDPNEVQLSTLLSIKTGGCAEDCGYCPQSAHFDTGLEASKIMSLDEVLEAARAAKEQGATRFCMGAAWRSPKERDMERVVAMIEGVRELGLETCMTLGMLDGEQARQLKDAGLDYYNHNLDTSPDYYGHVISTRTYQDRLDTLASVRQAGINVCCGGIVGMGETRTQRAGLIAQLANLDPYPESVPINHLVAVPGTPLADAEPIDPFEFVRTIAVARITMPTTMVRLSAGREQMDDALQTLCFAAGANSIFYGDRLLTTTNPQAQRDRRLFERLGLKPQGERPAVKGTEVPGAEA